MMKIHTPTLNAHPPRDSVFIVHIVYVFIVVVFFVVVVLTPISTLASSSLLLSSPNTECFVDVNNGNDTDTCGNETNPCKSLGACMNDDGTGNPTLTPKTWLYPGKYVGAENCNLLVANENATIMPKIQNSYVEIQCPDTKNFILVRKGNLYLSGVIISNSNYGIDMINLSNNYVTIVNCTFRDCSQASIDGSVNEQDLTNGNLTIINSTFVNNGYLSNLGPVFISNSHFIDNLHLQLIDCQTVTIISSTFISNENELHWGGGAINFFNYDIFSEMIVHIENCVFDGNKADLGAAIYHDVDGTLNITSTVFLNNNATQNGSALYLLLELKNNLYLNNVTFVNNLAPSSPEHQGGTIYILSNFYVGLKPFTWNNVLIENNFGGGIVLDNFVDSTTDFTITGVTLSNNIPSNLQCVDSINFTFCESACVAKTCSVCPGSCDITKNNKLPVCHHSSSLSCSPQKYCVYPSLLSLQQPTCACINDNMMGENCTIPIHNENNNNNKNNKSCKNGSCWYIGLIVGILVLISFPFIVYFGRKYYQRKKYTPLSKLIQDQ